MTEFIRVTVDDRTVLAVLGQLAAAGRDLCACSARSGADPALFREQATGAASADLECDQAVAAMLRGARGDEPDQ